MSADPRDTNHDGKVSLMEKVKDKLHLGHKDHDTSSYTSTHHTATSATHHMAGAGAHHTTTAAVPATVAAVPAVAMAAPMAAVPLATSSIQTSSAYDSRDLNRDGHVSASEKLMSHSGHSATTGSAYAASGYDSRDLNRDGHVSTGEKLAADARLLQKDEAVLRLHEEQLAISKREVGAGEVGIHKRVEAERVEQSVPLRREEVIVERRPLSGIADPNARIMEQDEILKVPLHREEVIAEKRVVPIEEVVVRKKEVIDNQVVGATLRSEYVDTVQTQTSHNASLTGASMTGAYTDSRDLNRDGHVSMGEKLKTAPDANRDGHVSMGEKIKAARG